MPRIILDLHVLNRNVLTMLDAYDIPVDNFIDELLASNDSLLGRVDERLPVIENILASHSPSDPIDYGDDDEDEGADSYSRFEADTRLLDNALHDWRVQIERAREDFRMEPHLPVSMVRVVTMPSGVVVDMELVDE